jgi:hypothetical protein
MRVVAVAAVFALCVTAAAAKEAPTGLRVCGASGCTTIANVAAARAAVGDSTPASAVPPAAYVTVELTPKTDDLWATKPFYYVPSAQAIRVRDSADVGEWRSPGAAAAAVLASAAAAVRPFAPPSRVQAAVDRRRASDGASYLGLYSLAGPRRPDPAGPRPGGVAWERAHEWALYYARVRRVWAYVDLESTPPSPWTDGRNDLWIDRHGALLRRDGVVVAIPPVLAAKVRAGQSLR